MKHFPLPTFRAADDAGADAPVYDAEAVRAAVAEAVAQLTAAGATPVADGAAARNLPAVNGRADVTVEGTARQFASAELPVVTDPAERDFLGRRLFRLFHGQALGSRGHAIQESALSDLARRGYYGDEARAAAESGERSFSTLTDADGGVFLPEVVLNEVLRLVPQYGVIRRLARVVNAGAGTIRIPNLSSGLVAFWVGEGQEIKARKAVFGKVTLDPEKMGLIVPWTTELEEEAGASFLQIVVELIAEAFGLLEDTTGFYGDGTSTYGGITGLATASGVNVLTLPSTKTAFTDVAYDDFVGALGSVPASVRFQGTWVFHPDMLTTIAKIKDSDGRPLFLAAGGTIERDTFMGRPVVFSQAMYANSATAVSKVFAFYGDFSKFIIAQGRGMTMDLLTEATITDVDDSGDIRLGAQDMKALRTTQRLDMLVAIGSAFVRMRTAAS